MLGRTLQINVTQSTAWRKLMLRSVFYQPPPHGGQILVSAMMIDAQDIRWRQERYKLSLAFRRDRYTEGCLHRVADGILDKIHPARNVRPIGTHSLQRCVTQQHCLLRNGIAAITFLIDKLAWQP